MPKVTLLCHTPEPERVVAAAAKLCYSAQSVEGLLDDLTPEKTAGFLKMLMDLGHESPAEHASFTFAIEGVSRALLAQITRHRLASYSVQSQRYVRLSPFEYVTPPEVEADPQALLAYGQAMQSATESYEKITTILKEKHLATLLAQGVPPSQAQAKAEKQAIEDARFVLPNACETRMVVTMNARSLYNFFHHRCCTRAQWEIRAVADKMLMLVKEVAPILFSLSGPPCVSGNCPEGKMSCGRMSEMRERYKGAQAP
ncbi:MAG: FAD-dependent thymidylate synthase [Candidatus Fimivivens sp.]